MGGGDGDQVRLAARDVAEQEAAAVTVQRYQRGYSVRKKYMEQRGAAGTVGRPTSKDVSGFSIAGTHDGSRGRGVALPGSLTPPVVAWRQSVDALSWTPAGVESSLGWDVGWQAWSPSGRR